MTACLAVWWKHTFQRLGVVKLLNVSMSLMHCRFIFKLVITRFTLLKSLSSLGWGLFTYSRQSQELHHNPFEIPWITLYYQTLCWLIKWISLNAHNPQNKNKFPESCDDRTEVLHFQQLIKKLPAFQNNKVLIRTEAGENDPELFVRCRSAAATLRYPFTHIWYSEPDYNNW